MENSVDLPPFAATRTPLIGSLHAQTRSYIAFVLLGLATLLPFNFYIMANSYFCFKLNDSSIVNETAMHLGSIYESSVIVCASFTNLITLICVTIKCVPYVLKYRIYTSFVIIIVCILLTLAPAFFEGIHYPVLFFVVTMVLVIIQSICSAVLLNCFYSLASTLPSEFIQGFGLGQALGGVLVSICLIISLSLSAKLSETMPIYFSCAIAVIIASIIIYYFLEKTHLFQIYSSSAQEINNDREAFVRDASADSESYTVSVVTMSIPQRLLVIYRRIQWNFWGIFFTFIATFSVFPGVLSKIRASDPRFQTKLFVPIATFLMFFLGDTLGRMISSKVHRPSLQSRRWLFFVCLLRFLFILLFYFCNFPSAASYKTGYKNDFVYGALVFCFALSHGYCNSLNLMYAPRRVQVEFTGSVGALMMMAVGAGTFVGSSISYGVLFLYKISLLSGDHACPEHSSAN